MKKILLLLLFTIASYGQAVFDEGIQITGNANSATATKVNVQETDGTINYILKSSLIDVAESNSAINLPVVGVVGKIYITKDNNKIYRWNGTFYQELAANDANVVHLTGNETKNGNLGVNSLILANNPIGSVANELKQTIGVDDWWKIYGKSDILDRSEMVFEVGDNGEPFSDTGQRFRFHYNSDATGLEKDAFIIDYNEITANANLTATSFIKSGGTSAQFLKADGSLDSTNYAPFSGGTSYIQNQASNPQSANIWVSGIGVFGSDIAAVNGVFSGTISASPAIAPNQVVVKSQLDAVAASSGTYTPTFSNLVNVGTVNITNAVYTKVGNIIQGRCTASISTITIGLDTSFDFSLPQARNSQTNIFLCGNGARFHGSTIVNGITYIQSINTGRFIFKASGSIGSSDIVTFNFQYDITQ